MFISVVVPLYNKEKTVRRAIESVLNQTHQDFEIIVVNDGSTDASLEAARAVADPRLRLIDQPNRGVSAARNEGVRVALHPWVAFLDADDEYLPGFLEKVASFVERHAGRPLSFVSSNIIYSDTGAAAFPGLASGVYDYFGLCRADQTPATSSSTAVCREAFRRAGGFPEGTRQFEDWNLWCRLAWLGGFGFIGEPLCLYHIAKSGTASTMERDPRAYYADAVLLPRLLADWRLERRIPGELARSSARYVNRFLLQQARVLRWKRQRLLALRLLGKVEVAPDPVSLFLLLKTCALLLAPVGIKELARRLTGRVR